MNWWVLYHRVHSSWIIALCCVGIFIGVVLAKYLYGAFSSYIYLIIVIFLIFSCCYRRVIALPLVVAAGLLIGMARGSALNLDLEKFKPLYERNITVSAAVADDVDMNSGGKMTLRLSRLVVLDKVMPGSLWAVSDSVDIKRGDQLTLSGVLKPGFGSFAGAIYQARILQIIHPQIGDPALLVRDWFASKIRNVIDEPESSLGIGFLVGQRRSLPADLTVALQAVGLTHIVVASGYNLTILVRLARRLFAKVSKYLSAMASLAMIAGFIAVTGASPSMVRAGIVSILSLGAWYYGRQFHPIILLSIAVAVTVLANPIYAWGDIGWQLSFAAFAGVIVLAPLAKHYFFGDSKINLIAQILIETVAAQIVTMPIIVLVFGQISNVTIVTNLLVLPLVPLAMLLVFMSGISGSIAPFMAGIVSLPAVLVLKYMTGVINFFADLPWASSKVQVNLLMVVGCYILITSGCLYMWHATKYNLREVNLVE